jgi:rubrerythrin
MPVYGKKRREKTFKTFATPRAERNYSKPFHSCRFKFRHEQVWTAQAQIASLQIKHPNDNFMFYACEHCGYVHVGRVHTGAVFMYDAWTYTVGNPEGG